MTAPVAAATSTVTFPFNQPASPPTSLTAETSPDARPSFTVELLIKRPKRPPTEDAVPSLLLTTYRLLTPVTSTELLTRVIAEPLAIPTSPPTLSCPEIAPPELTSVMIEVAAWPTAPPTYPIPSIVTSLLDDKIVELLRVPTKPPAIVNPLKPVIAEIMPRYDEPDSVETLFKAPTKPPKALSPFTGPVVKADMLFVDDTLLIFVDLACPTNDPVNEPPASVPPVKLRF